jgi:hypothetical protein
MATDSMQPKAIEEGAIEDAQLRGTRSISPYLDRLEDQAAIPIASQVKDGIAPAGDAVAPAAANGHDDSPPPRLPSEEPEEGELLSP